MVYLGLYKPMEIFTRELLQEPGKNSLAVQKILPLVLMALSGYLVAEKPQVVMTFTEPKILMGLLPGKSRQV